MSMLHHQCSPGAKFANRQPAVVSLLVGLGLMIPSWGSAHTPQVSLALETSPATASPQPLIPLVATAPPNELAQSAPLPVLTPETPDPPLEVPPIESSQSDSSQSDSSNPEFPESEPSPVSTQTDPMLLYDAKGWMLRSHLQFGLNGVFERNLYWNLAETFAPDADFDADTNWLELYIKPGLSFTGEVGEAMALYGRLSAVASGTFGTDAFDTGDTGRVTLEEAHLGLRTTHPDRVNFDISVGPRELKLGTGMLIANGASNGFERGALKLGPRKAWEFAAIGRVSYDDFVGTAFFLDPNELPSNSTSNRLAGVDLRYGRPNNNYAGLTYINVLDSQAPYPRSSLGRPPEIIPGARDGLNATNLYARVTPFQGDLETLFLAFDAAYEWNNRINLDAWGGRVQVGYTLENAPWSPTLTYSYQTFSGDDPSTSRLERFDPLYYEGSPSAWATGSKAAAVFINSNVQSHQLALRLSPSQRDTVTLRYAHVRVNEVRSPVQFGQATRFDFSVGAVTPGVTDPHLSDDVFLEYNRVLNPNTFLTVGASISRPGKGIRSLLGEDESLWYGGFANIVFNF